MPVPATHCQPWLLEATSPSTSRSRKCRAPTGHHTCRSLVRKQAVIIRTRLCIQPSCSSWRIPASTIGKPVVPVRQASIASSGSSYRMPYSAGLRSDQADVGVVPQHVGVELAPRQLGGVRRRGGRGRRAASAGAARRGGGRGRGARCRRGRAGCARRSTPRRPSSRKYRQRRQAASSPAAGRSTGQSATAFSSRSRARSSESAGARSGERGVGAGSDQPCSRQARAKALNTW